MLHVCSIRLILKILQCSLRPLRHSSLDVYLSLVESKKPGDLFGSGLGRLVRPSYILQGHSIDFTVVIRGSSFPRTCVFGIRRLQESVNLEGLPGEILVSLEGDGVVSLGDGRSFVRDAGHVSLGTASRIRQS